MLFVIQFRDNPAKLHLRGELMPAHLEFLRAKGAAVRTAGSLRKEDDGPIGGLWIVEAANFDEAKRFFAEDPFWKAGLRASVEVHRLAKAFPEVENGI